MPTTARANRTNGDAEAGAAQAEKCKKARVTLLVLSVLQTVLQHAAEAFADKTKELSDVLGSINIDELVAEPDVWLQHIQHIPGAPLNSACLTFCSFAHALRAILLPASRADQC